MIPPAFAPLAPSSLRGTPLFRAATSTQTSPSPRRLHTPSAVAEPASPASAAALAASFDNVVMPTYARYPLAMSHGLGAELHTVDGRVFLDCVAGIATCTLGHAHPAVVDAVSAQIRRVTHVSNLYYIPEQGALAALLVQHSPMDKAFFCNSGGEANEAAIKLARKRWHLRNGSTKENHGTPVILTAWQSFHGRTIATLTATGQDKYHANWWPLVDGFDYVTYNDPKDLREKAEKAGNNLAGVLLEALQGEGGIHPGTKEFFATAREVCDNVGALLMCDEVQVGVGRSGKLWGFEHTGVEPDVFTTAKGLGGGVPIGAMLCKDECNVFTPGDHASTFGGNPLASAAGLAIGKELLEGGVLENARVRGEQLGKGLEDLKAKYGSVVADVRGLGLIRGIELKGVAAGNVVKVAMDKGLLLVPAGMHVVRFVPPLVITEEQVEQVLTRFEEALKEVTGV